MPYDSNPHLHALVECQVSSHEQSITWQGRRVGSFTIASFIMNTKASTRLWKFIRVNFKSDLWDLELFQNSALGVIYEWPSSILLFDYYLFILLVAIEDFSLTLRRHYYGFRVSDLDLCSVLTVIEQWGIISVPYLMCKGPRLLSSEG